jgi:histone acetyltransferase (RNA polymerase elongator complex component)
MKKCIICGGKLTEREENVSTECTCEDCNCLQSNNGEVIEINSNINFYIANYGTNQNIEIFQDYEDAKKESIDNFVHQAILNHSRVYFDIELNGWNYEDKFDLFLSTPSLVGDN